jgi:dynein heavy chain
MSFRHTLANPIFCCDCSPFRWHDDFNSFKAGVKDLEVMMTNVIQIAVEAQSCLSARMELLEAFQLISKRDFIKCVCV